MVSLVVKKIQTSVLRIKQYGWLSCLKKYIFLAIIKSIFNNYKNIILIISNHRQDKKSNAKIIDLHKIKKWANLNEINKIEEERFMFFLENNCKGYYIEVENKLAAWGFVQTKGTYKYGSYFYEIPEGVHVLKNLYVKPNFRGMSLGKKINETRINDIPDFCIPCGFVIPENRYALRNLKMYGFKEHLEISHTSWFKKYTKTTVQVIQKNKLNEIITKGFKTL